MSNTNPPLHLAVQNGNIDIVKMLLETGHCPNEANGEGLTPLHIAVQMGHTDIVALLAGKINESGNMVTPPDITPEPITTNGSGLGCGGYLQAVGAGVVVCLIVGRFLSWPFRAGASEEFKMGFVVIVTVIAALVAVWYAGAVIMRIAGVERSVANGRSALFLAIIVPLAIIVYAVISIIIT